MKTTLIGAVVLVALVADVAAMRSSSQSGAPCNVQGVWRLDRATRNGKPIPATGSQWKIMTKDRFMWVEAENRRDTLPLKTYRDTVRVMSTVGGYGTYSVSGSTVTEHIVLFPDPTWAGRDFKAQCRMESGLWVHTWFSDFYNDSTGRSRRDTVVEYYRKDG